MKSPRGGRPRIDPLDISVNVHIRVSAKLFDRSEKQAAAARLSLADWIRTTLEKACQDPQKR